MLGAAGSCSAAASLSSFFAASSFSFSAVSAAFGLAAVGAVSFSVPVHSFVEPNTSTNCI